jgi:hypothetical protein
MVIEMSNNQPPWSAAALFDCGQRSQQSDTIRPTGNGDYNAQIAPL